MLLCPPSIPPDTAPFPHFPSLSLAPLQLLNLGRFIEALIRLSVLACSRPPLNTLYPSDGDKVDAVFRRVGMGDAGDILRRLRDPSAAGFRAAGVNHPLFVLPPSRQSHVRGMQQRVAAAKNERSPTSASTFLAALTHSLGGTEGGGAVGGSAGAATGVGAGAGLFLDKEGSSTVNSRVYSSYSIPPDKAPGGRSGPPASSSSSTLLTAPLLHPGPLTDLAALAASELENWRYAQIVKSTTAAAASAATRAQHHAQGPLAAPSDPLQGMAVPFSSPMGASYDPPGPAAPTLTSQQVLNMQQQHTVAQQLGYLQKQQAAVMAASVALQSQRLAAVNTQPPPQPLQQQQFAQQHFTQPMQQQSSTPYSTYPQQQQQQQSAALFSPLRNALPMQQEQPQPQPQPQAQAHLHQQQREAEALSRMVAEETAALARDMHGAPPPSASTYRSILASHQQGGSGAKAAELMAGSYAAAGAAGGTAASASLYQTGRVALPPGLLPQHASAYAAPPYTQHAAASAQAHSRDTAEQQYYFIDPVKLGTGKVQLGAMGVESLKAGQGQGQGQGQQVQGGGAWQRSSGVVGVSVGDSHIQPPFKSPQRGQARQVQPKVWSGQHK